MARTTPQETLKLPSKPGVYQMKDAEDGLLYVGKAKNLKNRVGSYFQNSVTHSHRIQSMVKQVHHIDYTITETEWEALILEANMVKQLRPKYNILLRDDKKYPWLVLTKEPFPRLVFTREPYLLKNGQLDWSRCFGPYPSASVLYQTLQVVKKIFPLRQRRTPLFKDRPCMNYHIGTCMGPCQQLISPAEYQKIVDQVVLFLKGHADDLQKMLMKDMQQASEAMQFERAGVLRDRLLAIDQIIQHQKVMYENPNIHQDIIACAEASKSGKLCFTIFKVRRGKLVQSLFFDIDIAHGQLSVDAYEDFIAQYYQQRADLSELPDELILQFELEEPELLLSWFEMQAKHKVKLTVPKLGRKKELLALAIQNAEEATNRAQIESENQLRTDPANAIMQLQEALKLPTIPRRMECYDISHIQGTNTVASMVVFTDGQPDKKAYRYFKIKTTAHGMPDDFQSMREVMFRRFHNHKDDTHWPEPDLIIIDGGKGQLSAAIEGLAEAGVKAPADQAIISLAKKFEEVYLPNQTRPVILPRNSMSLFLLQQIRDEAHRFAVKNHRLQRAKTQTASYLDNVPGIGPARKQRLLSKYPTLKHFREASIPDLAEVLKTSEEKAFQIQERL